MNRPSSASMRVLDLSKECVRRYRKAAGAWDRRSDPDPGDTIGVTVQPLGVAPDYADSQSMGLHAPWAAIINSIMSATNWFI